MAAKVNLVSIWNLMFEEFACESFVCNVSMAKLNIMSVICFNFHEKKNFIDNKWKY